MIGEHKLMVAMLREAVNNLAGIVAHDADGTHGGRGGRPQHAVDLARRDARRWIDSPTALGDTHFTFLQVCFELGLRPSRVRALLSTDAGIAEARRILTVWARSQSQVSSARKVGYRLGFKRKEAA